MSKFAIIMMLLGFVVAIEMFDRAGERHKEIDIAKLELAEVCIKIAYGSNDTANAKELEEIIKELK